LSQLIGVPAELELIAMYRLGYMPDDKQRPSIDWTSSHRKKLSQYVFRDTCRTPETDPEGTL
jgi:hypothetical protein